MINNFLSTSLVAACSVLDTLPSSFDIYLSYYILKDSLRFIIYLLLVIIFHYSIYRLYLYTEVILLYFKCRFFNTFTDFFVKLFNNHADAHKSSKKVYNMQLTVVMKKKYNDDILSFR